MARTKKVNTTVTSEIAQVTSEVNTTANEKQTKFTIEQLADMQKRKVIERMTELENELQCLWELEFKRNAAWLRRIVSVKKQVELAKEVLKATL